MSADETVTVANAQRVLDVAIAAAREEERERCAALLGKEVLRLLGCRDREDAEGIARAASILRDPKSAWEPNGPAKETP